MREKQHKRKCREKSALLKIRVFQEVWVFKYIELIINILT